MPRDSADAHEINAMLQQMPLQEQVVSLVAAIVTSDVAEDPAIAAASLVRMALVLTAYLSAHERLWLSVKQLEAASALSTRLN
jgi:hypothetical protein